MQKLRQIGFQLTAGSPLLQIKARSLHKAMKQRKPAQSNKDLVQPGGKKKGGRSNKKQEQQTGNNYKYGKY